LEIEKQVLLLIDDVLALEGRGLEFTASTPLLGAVPELDSMAVIGIINALEEQFDFIIGDDEIDGETFETVGSLVDFVRQKHTSFEQRASR